jgi:uncharacterized GH25 family protein
MKRQKWLLSLFAVCALVMASGLAMAHDLWLVPQTCNPDKGDTLKVVVGFGHKFPANRIDEKMRPGMLGAVSAVAPDGKVIKLEKKSDEEYALPIKAKGAYLISTRIKPVFFSRVEGKMKRGNKKDLGKVDTCMFFQMMANAPVFAGAGGKAPAAPAKQALQVLPLGDISKLKKGDTLPVKVLFKGAPLAGAKLRATYAGFKPPKYDPSKAPKPAPGLSPREAARQKMMHKMAARYPVAVETDAKGLARIKLPASGWWLVLLSHNTPFKDAAVCDKCIYKTTYTFEVR